MKKQELSQSIAPHGRSGGVQMAHKLGEAIGTLSEYGVRLAVYACADSVRTASRHLAIRIADVALEAGGEQSKMYRWAREASKELGIRYMLYDDGVSRFAHVGFLGSEEVRYEDGVLTMSLSEQTYTELVEQKSLHTLAHLANLKRIGKGKSRLAMYLMMARWDSCGSLDISSPDPCLMSFTKAKPRPSIFFRSYWTAAANHISARLGVEVKSTMTGRGRRAVYHLTWPPNALRKAAGDQPALNLSAFNETDILHHAACAQLRLHGVYSSEVMSRLMAMPASEAKKIVDQAIADGLDRQKLHDRVTARVCDYLLGIIHAGDVDKARQSAADAETHQAAIQERVAALGALAAPGGPRRTEYEAWLAGQDEFLQGAAESVRLAAWAGEQMGVS